MDFNNYLKDPAQKINWRLDQLAVAWQREAKKEQAQLAPIVDVFLKANQGGKRVRGALVRLGFEMAGGKGDEISEIATALEVFQTAILVHDDIIDKSPLRRGQPTVYRSLGGDHYGISQAIVLGDIGFFLAIRLIAQSNFREGVKNQAIDYFTKICLKTFYGEILDVALSRLGKINSRGDVLNIARLKTSYYSVAGPLCLGVILAGGSDSLVQKVENFGQALGIALQIQDDINGIFGSKDKIGKSVTSDIEEGKQTLLAYFVYQKADKKQKKILKRYYGKKVGNDGLEAIKQVLVQTGALQKTQKVKDQYIRQAKKAANLLDVSQDYKNLLLDLADFV